MRALMLSDVIVSTSYVLPLSFAGRDGKTSIVYYSLQEISPYVEGVSFVNDPGALAKVFQEACELKQAQMHLVDVMKRVMPWAGAGGGGAGAARGRGAAAAGGRGW